MRFTYLLAIVLLLGFAAVGMASGQAEPTGGNSAGQGPATPAPAEQAPAESTPAAGKKAPESAAKAKNDAVSPGTSSASPTTKRRKHTPAPASAPDGGPRRVVVREGGASEPTAQIVPGMTPAEAARQRQNAERLLGSTGGELKQLAGRALDARQQETVEQIRNYMEGARSALQEGDVRRADTLAEKAHLLAEDLARH